MKHVKPLNENTDIVEQAVAALRALFQENGFELSEDKTEPMGPESFEGNGVQVSNYRQAEDTVAITLLYRLTDYKAIRDKFLWDVEKGIFWKFEGSSRIDKKNDIFYVEQVYNECREIIVNDWKARVQQQSEHLQTLESIAKTLEKTKVIDLHNIRGKLSSKKFNI